MFDLNIRRYDENPFGEATRVVFCCGCMMRPAGPGLVLRSCCRDHVPNESGDRVVLGALEDGPWLIDGPVLRMRIDGGWRGADQRNASLALVMEQATDPDWQRATRERQRAIDKLFDDPPNGGENAGCPPGQNAPLDGDQLVPAPESESQTFRYQFRRLRTRLRQAVSDFWENFPM